MDWAPACEPRCLGLDSQSGACPGCRPGPIEGSLEATTHFCFSPFLSEKTKTKTNKILKIIKWNNVWKHQQNSWHIESSTWITVLSLMRVIEDLGVNIKDEISWVLFLATKSFSCACHQKGEGMDVVYWSSRGDSPPGRVNSDLFREHQGPSTDFRSKHIL